RPNGPRSPPEREDGQSEWARASSAKSPPARSFSSMEAISFSASSLDRGFEDRMDPLYMSKMCDARTVDMGKPFFRCRGDHLAGADSSVSMVKGAVEGDGDGMGDTGTVHRGTDDTA